MFNCEECGQDVTTDRFGQFIHSYQLHDDHAPVIRWRWPDEADY